MELARPQQYGCGDKNMALPFVNIGGEGQRRMVAIEVWDEYSGCSSH
jgi:hypothetical protein